MSDGYLWLLIADACMTGVILSVQLVVYPAFSYYPEKDLTRWHGQYTRNITLLVLPLMAGQLLGGFYWLLTRPGLPSWGYTFLVCLLWGITFYIFVPLHHRIGRGVATRKDLSRLVYKNWLRTVLWILLFIWHLSSYHGMLAIL